jgi:hypothetical protein
VEEVLEFGKPFHFGLEAGSKPGTDGGNGAGRQRHPDHLQWLQGR